MFQFQYEYTLEDMKILSRVTARLYNRRKVLIRRTVLGVMGLAYLFIGGILLGAGNALVGGILLTAGVIFASMAVFYHTGAAWRSKRMMAEGMGLMTVTLEDATLRGETGKGGASYPYDEVTEACHFRGRYFLFLDKRHAMLLPERALVQGQQAGLKPFLEKKLGKEIRDIY